MKKQGICLVELLVYMFIIGVFSSINLSLYRKILDVQEDMILDRTMVQCRDFIIAGKNTCKEREFGGYILFNEIEKEVIFIINGKMERKFKIPDNIKIKKITFEARKMCIDNTGYIKNAGGVYFQNRHNTRKITVGVYTNYVNES